MLRKSSYAKNTTVKVEKSRLEIERTLKKYGVTQHIFGTNDSGDFVLFMYDSWKVKIFVETPPRSDFERLPKGSRRLSPKSIDLAWDKAKKQRYRALFLLIKAKLEAVASGIIVFEKEFYPYLATKSGETVFEQGQKTLPSLKVSLEKNPNLFLEESQ